MYFQERAINLPFVALLVSNGVSIQATKTLNITIDAGLGKSELLSPYEYLDEITYQFGINVEYRF